MSLSDEFQKMLQESRNQLDQDETNERRRYDQDKARFCSLPPILEELATTVGDRFIRIEVDDDPPRISAKIYVGDYSSKVPRLTLRRITPIDNADGEPEWLFGGTAQEVATFKNIDDLMQHLLPEIAWEIAELQKEAEKEEFDSEWKY